MCGNVHAVFAVVSPKRRGSAKDFHRWWNMGASLWIWKQTSKHGMETHVIAQD